MADYTVSVTLRAVDQFSSTVQALNTELTNVATNSTNATPSAAQTSGWDNYKNALQGAQVAMGTVNIALGMLAQGYNFGQLGEDVIAVSAAFEALQGSPEIAAESLDVLRAATSGVVADMDLMSASNRLQSMGLADNSEQMAELIGMAQQLGGVMSPGATTAQNIDNFTLLLANQSVRRLDSFGISADAVRTRIDELKEAGYGAEDAFTMATLEQGRIALANLGDAATVGATNVDRLTTRWQNFVNVAASGAADVLNAAAGSVDMISQIIAAGEGGQLVDAFLAPSLFGGDNSYAGGASGRQGLVGGVGGGAGDNGITSEGGFGAEDRAFGDASQRAAEENALTREQIEREAVAAQMAFEAINVIDFKEMTGGLQVAGTSTAELAANARAAEAEFAKFAESIGNTDFAVLDGAALSMDLIGARAESSGRIISDTLDNALELYNLADFESTTTVGGAQFARGDVDGQALFTAEESQAAADMAAYYNDLVTDAELLHEQGLISDAELANVEATSDAAGELADNAQRGADAFANMTLAQAFGIEGGGMAGEMSDDVLAYMEAQGMSTEGVDTTLQLATGQETLSNLAYENTVTPMVADIIATYGAAAGAEAIAAVQQGLEQAALTGASQEDIAAMLPSMTGYDYVSQMVGGGDAGMGGLDSESSTLQEIPTEDPMAASAASAAEIEGSLTTAAGSAAEIGTNFISAGIQAGAIATRLAGINGMTMRLNIQLNTEGARGAIMDLINEAIGDNGGQVPGTNHPGGGGQ